MSWIDEEPGLAHAARELLWLGRRALRHPLWVMGIAAALAVVAVMLRRESSVPSRIVLRVVEGDLEAATSPRPNARLKDYIEGVVFSRGHLLEVIRAHGLYPSRLARDPALAVEAMRDDLQVEVWRNYFLAPREADAPPASARVAISYRAHDGKLADAVVQDLARLLVQEQEAHRLHQTEAAAAAAAIDLDQARRALARRRAARVERSILPLTDAVHERELQKSALDLRVQFERSKLGLQFQLVDAGHRGAGFAEAHRLSVLGLLTFLLTLPLAALAVASFDPKVYDTRDVERLGLASLGSLPRGVL